MIRLAISVEGPTEAEFVKTVLAAHLRGRDVEATPILVGGRGGNVTVELLARHMASLFRSFDCVTSLVDLYGFRTRDNPTAEVLEQRIDVAIRKQIGRRYDRTRVFAYVQQHEFEGLLFSDTRAFKNLDVAPPGAPDRLQQRRCPFKTPEDIDRNDPPAKLIQKEIPRYQKRLHGPLLAEAIGLELMRSECPRFGKWLSTLESLGSGAGGETADR